MQRFVSFQTGFTLIEMLVAVSVAGVLCGIVYPSFQSAVLKARRSDALVALMQVQSAQERWRSNHGSYGSLDEIGMPPQTSNGHYRLQVQALDTDRYEVLALASGLQSRDGACRTLRLTLDSATVTHSSGPDAQQNNPPAMNRRCWNL